MESFLPNKLREKVASWRNDGYPSEHSTLGEILEFAFDVSETGTKSLRFLRKAQFEALETYWYIRVIERTPHVFDLYQKLYRDPVELFKALGIRLSEEDLLRLLSEGGNKAVFDEIKNNDGFAKKYRLQAVRETLLLDYPSYIFALAMGAGKTFLIGAIVATEFALALEHPGDFVKNALVFAPGKTILGALREISDVPYEKILPQRLYNQFISSLKITYTQDNEKDIRIASGSSFNVIVTNTEKIRIQKTVKSNLNLTLLNYRDREALEEEEETANLRLQAISSLPSLAIFSDEAHHTYGQSLDKELKKVRKTVDYLSANTNVIVVVNTTGTPYYKKQMLRDVVFWYGLAQGIKDGILKEVKDSIISYQDVTSEQFVNQVLGDFLNQYGKLSILGGCESKLAMYFPQTDDLERLRPVVEKRVRALGYDPSIVLEVHNKSDEDVKDLFNNRINESHNPYRVYLLVNMGTEGWNCPSLFATALVRRLKTSNNFVLQAASRCLRQIPGNKVKARIYLSKDNVGILDNQLRETYGETLEILDKTRQEIRREKLTVLKTEVKPVLIKRKVRRVVPVESGQNPLSLQRPVVRSSDIKKITYDVKDLGARSKILTTRSVESVAAKEGLFDLHEVANDLSSIYRIDLVTVYELLQRIYSEGTIPVSHIDPLKQQIENQTARYTILEETVEVALALVNLHGFSAEKVGNRVLYTVEIAYNPANEDLMLSYEQFRDRYKRGFGFHYSPYNLDSRPEKDVYTSLLESLEENPDDIDDVYYIGGITDPKKTDFVFEYKDKKGVWRGYTPDFVVRKKNGKVLIVETKADVYRDLTKEMALTEIANLNPDTLKYEVLPTEDGHVEFGYKERINKWIYSEGVQ